MELPLTHPDSSSIHTPTYPAATTSAKASAAHTPTPGASPLSAGPWSTPAPAPSISTESRLTFIDNLRWVMIMLVLSMHAAVTYSNVGSWYYNERATLGKGEMLTFVTYQTFLQSFFMGLLFFVAGYFVPSAYDKKGILRFLRDRAIRLGLPILLYIFILHPVTEYFILGNWDSGSPDRTFLHEYYGFIFHGWWVSATGPLWFCAALLIFNAVYAAWRCLRPASHRTKPNHGSASYADSPIAGHTQSNNGPASHPRPFPGASKIVLFVLLITTATFFIRIPWPLGTSCRNMQFCYFPQYIAFFIVGTIAFRNSWLTTLPTSIGKSWGLTALIGGLVFWLLLLVGGGALQGKSALYSGGWTLQSVGLSFLESFAGTGLSLGCLALFRQRFNLSGRITKFFSDNAFAAYVFHPPILIGLTLLMRSFHQPPLIKFVEATAFSIVLTWAICALLLRRIPLLKNIL